MDLDSRLSIVKLFYNFLSKIKERANIDNTLKAVNVLSHVNILSAGLWICLLYLLQRGKSPTSVLGMTLNCIW